jgi:hypothetical protein
VRASTRQRDRRREERAEAYNRGIDRHNLLSPNIIVSAVCVTRRVSRIAASDKVSRDHCLRVATLNDAPRVPSRHHTSRIPAAMDVLAWMRVRIAHVATSGRASIVPRRVVRAAKAILATPGHAVAWIVILCVVPTAIADLNSGFVGVSVFAVAETHLGGREIDWGVRKTPRLGL